MRRERVSTERPNPNGQGQFTGQTDKLSFSAWPGRFRPDSDYYEIVNLLEFPATQFEDISSTLAFRLAELANNFIL